MKLKNSVVVITGASSGIGRATALLLAEKGANVIAAARNKEALQSLVDEAGDAGGAITAYPLDVTDEPAVRRMARSTFDRFGRIDVWVNNAAVMMFGPFEEAPSESFRRVIETNLFGYVNGARAVVPLFREQGEGILINVSSVAGRIGMPFTCAYDMSKSAIDALTACLRQELLDTRIKVCRIEPASIDTPLFQHGANYMGKAVKPVSPVYPPEIVARAIASCIERPRRTVIAGNIVRVPVLMRIVAPGFYERAATRSVKRSQYLREQATPGEGNLFGPMPGWESASGGWRGSTRRRPLAIAAGGAGLLAFVVRLALRRRSRR
jgi:NAD(P)-dependent dehydrogenase (short-subunit alcohol dehydrogenase family)